MVIEWSRLPVLEKLTLATFRLVRLLDLCQMSWIPLGPHDPQDEQLVFRAKACHRLVNILRVSVCNANETRCVEF